MKDYSYPKHDKVILYCRCFHYYSRCLQRWTSQTGTDERRRVYIIIQKDPPDDSLAPAVHKRWGLAPCNETVSQSFEKYKWTLQCGLIEVRSTLIHWTSICLRQCFMLCYTDRIWSLVCISIMRFSENNVILFQMFSRQPRSPSPLVSSDVTRWDSQRSLSL